MEGQGVGGQQVFRRPAAPRRSATAPPLSGVYPVSMSPRRNASSRTPSTASCSGDDAPIHAAMRADELLENGDVEGKAVWMRILRAVDELMDRLVPEDVVRH